MIGDCLLALVSSLSEHVEAPARDSKRLSDASLQVRNPTMDALTASTATQASSCIFLLLLDLFCTLLSFRY